MQMAKKKCYIYRLEAGYDKKPPEVTEFFYAPNAKRLIQYAQTLYRKEKYNKFKPTKVGTTKEDEGIRLVSDFENLYLKQHMTADFYSERNELK
jgi:hypothetical protein